MPAIPRRAVSEGGVAGCFPESLAFFLGARFAAAVFFGLLCAEALAGGAPCSGGAATAVPSTPPLLLL